MVKVDVEHRLRAPDSSSGVSDQSMGLSLGHVLVEQDTLPFIIALSFGIRVGHFLITHGIVTVCSRQPFLGTTTDCLE